MRSKIILNILLLITLVGLITYLYYKPSEEKNVGIPISKLDKSGITKIKINKTGLYNGAFEKSNGSWYIAKPIRGRGDKFKIERLIETLEANSKQKYKPDNVEQYGLAPPNATLVLNNQIFNFGAINKITNEQYLESQGWLYLVNTHYGYNIPVNLDDFFSRKLLAESESPIKFDFGNWQTSKSQEGNWHTEGEIEKISNNEFNQWVAEWRMTNSLKTRRKNNTNSSGQKVKITFDNGGTVTFTILVTENEIIVTREDEDISYYLGIDAGTRLMNPYRSNSN